MGRPRGELCWAEQEGLIFVFSMAALVSHSPRETRRISLRQEERHGTRARSVTARVFKGAGQGTDSGDTFGGEGALFQQRGGAEDQGGRWGGGIGGIGF